MKKRVFIFAASIFFALGAVAYAAGMFHEVKEGVFDPAKTNLVSAKWLEGTGCPTGATTFDGSTKSTYTDAACPTGDPKDSNKKDQKNEGLLLAKTGPTANYAAAGADLKDVPSSVTELGYDIRKAGAPGSATGSHCGAGAPRFDIVATDGSVYFLGCNSPPGTVAASSAGWIRLRWGAGTLVFPAAGGAPVALSSLNVKAMDIVLDEGQDAAPDNFGAAILDNIDVNGTLVGQH